MRSKQAGFQFGVTIFLLTVLVRPVAGQAMTNDERMIREARAASNRAIAAHDADAMAAYWMPDFHITPSTSVLRLGREDNRRSFTQLFSERPDVVYIRTPDTVALFLPWDVAAESGNWTGQWTQADGVTRIGGTYYAQWRKVGSHWLIQAEIFVPTSCEGSSYCSKRP